MGWRPEETVPRMALALVLMLTVAAAWANDPPSPGPDTAAESRSRPLPRRGGAARSSGAAASGEAGTGQVRSEVGARGDMGWLRTGLSLAGVVGLIIFLSWASRRTGAWTKQRRPGVIEVLSRASLAPRQTLCLVRVGARIVLLGMSRDRLTALDVIDDPEACARLAGEAETRRRGEFERRLAREETEFEKSGDGGEEELAPRPAQLAGVQDQIQAALRRIEKRKSA